ncbi:MAG: hypothetical protein GDA44_14570 [Prochloron sp. SP5CPC1]|nr:hypothetical protein [Candidatus Paraprochloron terpiosi SP5CPC1]
MAIKTQDSFLVIYNTELRYQGRSQQELYRFVEELLAENVNREDFRARVEEKLTEVQKLVKREEVRKVLDNYYDNLFIVSQKNVSLQLLSLFKKYQLDVYSLLRTISNLNNNVQPNSNLLDFEGLVVFVMGEYTVFEQIAPIIGVLEKKKTPQTFAKIIQYIALEYKHGTTANKFKQFIVELRKWQQSYNYLLAIRLQYSSEEYKLPEAFQANIPGEEIYQKYEDCLTEK